MQAKQGRLRAHKKSWAGAWKMRHAKRGGLEAQVNDCWSDEILVPGLGHYNPLSTTIEFTLKSSLLTL